MEKPVCASGLRAAAAADDDDEDDMTRWDVKREKDKRKMDGLPIDETRKCREAGSGDKVGGQAMQAEVGASRLVDEWRVESGVRRGAVASKILYGQLYNSIKPQR